jgi:4'-phosphopantetheinyl transferase
MHSLTPLDVHLWQAFVLDAQTAGLLDQYWGLLSLDETAQAKRFLFDKQRHRYLLTRALVRTVLSQYHSTIDPQDWQFETNAHGCPSITCTQQPSNPLIFNVSHTDEVVILAVRQQGALGIDIESQDRSMNLEVAERFFTQQETRGLKQLPANQQAAHFMALWTLKESYVKARTLGLSLSLQSFGFDMPTADCINLFFVPLESDQPARWQLMQWQLNPTHLLAACAERLHDAPLQWQLFNTLPLCKPPSKQPLYRYLLRQSL